MNTDKHNTMELHTKTWIFLIVLLVILLAAVILASQVQQDFGKVKVSNMTYQNYRVGLFL